MTITLESFYTNFLNKEKYLFLFILVISLTPIWYVEYFMTGDGPCHLYNSKILLDLLKQHNTDFYTSYYQVNSYPEPNWLTHFSFIILLFFFKAVTAEKIFLSIYVISFLFSLRALIKSINKESLPLVYLAIPFIYNHTFQMGFYNYCFSFPLMFYTIHFFLENKSSLTKWNILKLMLLFLITFFTHPVGYGLSCIVIGGILIKDSFNKFDTQFIKTFYKNSIPVFTAALPSIVFTLYYLSRKGINATPNPDSLETLTYELFKVTSAIAVNSNEHLYTLLYSIILWGSVIFILIYKFIKRQFSKEDIWFFYFAGALLLYFKQPGGAAGAGIVSIRIQLIPYLFMVLWIASVTLPKIFKLVISSITIILAVVLIAVRIPYYEKISLGVREHLSIRDLIDEKSTVAPLNFNLNGVDKNHQNIVDRIWLFNHTLDYLGTEKSLILFDNYEANTGYFPLIWQQNKNPYFTLYPHPEALPPDINLKQFVSEKSDAKVDYILVYALNESQEDHPYVMRLIEQLEGEYSFIGESENGFIKVFKSNYKIKKPTLISARDVFFRNKYETIKSYAVVDSSTNSTSFNTEYSQTFIASLDTFPCDGEHWLKLNCKIKSRQSKTSIPSMIISFENEKGIFNYNSIQLSDVGTNWQTYRLKTNLGTRQKGIIKAYLWNAGKDDLSVENFNIELLKNSKE